jgi:hypothetical protein
MNNTFGAIVETWERWGRRPAGVLSAPTEKAVTERIFVDGVLRREEFLEQLRLEKRRVDRSGNPLSMALFFLKEELLADVRKLRKFGTGSSY